MENFPQYRVISGLSTLIKTHTKRLKHYKAASIRAKNTPLKMLFKKYESHSQDSIKTLVGWLVNYGGPSYFPLETSEFFLAGEMMPVDDAARPGGAGAAGQADRQAGGCDAAEQGAP